MLTEQRWSTAETPEAEASAAPAFARDGRSLPRALTESALCLVVAVLLFRTFAAEGYMISTGSMAPHLLGYHKRVVCPACQHAFAFGMAYDTDTGGPAEMPGRTHAVCPNCGQSGIDVTDIPRNHGDQLLVFKPAYALQPPRRWEVAVFRNPFCPTEAYVKRVVGLPGEAVQLIDGDVYADGVLCRKDWSAQKQLRILVHQQGKTTDGVPPRWHPLPVETSAVEAWKLDDCQWLFRGAAAEQETAWGWVAYAHFQRSRGQYETSVKLTSWPVGIETSSLPPAGLRFDANRQRLSCQGVLPATVRDQLLASTTDEQFTLAVHQLAERSHHAPIDDRYGYNPPDADTPTVSVRDIMFTARVNVTGGKGEFAVELTDGQTLMTCVFDLRRQAIRAYAGDAAEPIWDVPLTPAWEQGRRLVECSLFDQQLMVAIDGAPVSAPWPLPPVKDAAAPRDPIRFGARGLDVAVQDLRIYRDVYYTATRGRHAIQEPYQLAGDELFMLGDNSPLSHDSRRWADGAVQMRLLVGKPFVVHLPSQPGRLRIGSQEVLLRLPDFSRMQWLP